MVIKDVISNRELKFLQNIVFDYRKYYKPATIYTGTENKKIRPDSRRGEVFFPNSYSSSLHSSIANIIYPYILQNYNKFKWDITEHLPELQFAKYKEGDHFKWHKDNLDVGHYGRILTMSINLTDEKNYKGGDLRVKYYDQEILLDKKPGSFIIFPAFLKHQADLIEEGTRDCLVVWAYSLNKNIKTYRENYEKLQKTKA